jgi:formylglycine-generating enzyme required for sulfatase activity
LILFHMRSPFQTALLLAATTPLFTLANNINVSNVLLMGKNTGSDTYQVQFDLSWENSWRTSSAEANYDAAWIFFKFRANNGLWQHGMINTTGHVAASGSTIATVPDAMGVYVHRSADGIGNVSYPAMQVAWNYGASGVADDAIIEIRVYALEMVYVPQGNFQIGDGSTTTIERQFEMGQSGAPYVVTSEAAITLGGPGATNLNARNNTGSSGSADDFTYAVAQTLPAAFPKGFQAYYMMKYECTEYQYVEFLNTLTSTQAAARFPNQTGIDGHTIDDTGTAPNIHVTTAPERVCGELDGVDVLAYADWAGLRPLSELEYEKACRGKLAAVAGEYPWGTTTLHSASYAYTNSGLANEAVSNPGSVNGNCQWGFTSVPTQTRRSGIFAGSFVTANRTQAGAGYFGAMELAGMVMELTVGVGNTQGRAFTGANGNGQLTAAGSADVPNWPGGNAFWTVHGGAYNSGSPSVLRTSDRSAANAGLSIGGSTYGMRLCRTQ